MRSVASLLVLLVLAVWLSACSSPEQQAAPPAPAIDGKALFDQTCARCHATTGKGDPTARAQLGVPDMSDASWQSAHPDEAIKRTVREGSKSKKMPPFGGLYSDAQLDAIIRHLRTFQQPN